MSKVNERLESGDHLVSLTPSFEAVLFAMLDVWIEFLSRGPFGSFCFQLVTAISSSRLDILIS